MSGFHGGIDEWSLKKAGIDPGEVKDFSVSINPAVLPEGIQRIIHRSALYRYPDSRSRNLVEAISREYGPPPEEILAVNGTSQAIYLIAAAFLKPGDATLIAGPTFSEYRDACEVVGARVAEHRADAETAFRPDVDELIRSIRDTQPRVFWICSPNNPTGSWLDGDGAGRLASSCREASCLMVIDEAYRCFSPPGLLSDGFFHGAVHLRSMTKDFCIPGLRLGWLRAEASVVEELQRRQPDWSVSAPAQDAGVASLADLPYFRESWKETRRETLRLAQALRELGLATFPTAANFVLVRVGDDAAVKHLSERLWKRLIQIRDCASFGLEGYIRIGTRNRGDIDELLAVMGEALK